MELPAKLSLGIPGFDTLLGGGIESKILTQFVGEGGTGKSTLSLLAAVSALSKGIGVIYIDTEGFSVERFSQIAGQNTEEYAKELYLFEPQTFAEQGLMIHDAEKLLRAGKAGLIILDSATALYRVEINDKNAIQILSQQMMYLQGLARRYNVPVIITNQVFMDIDLHHLAGLGGTALTHISKVIVNIEKHTGYRRAVILKHRFAEEGKAWSFILTGCGVDEKPI